MMRKSVEELKHENELLKKKVCEEKEREKLEQERKELQKQNFELKNRKLFKVVGGFGRGMQNIGRNLSNSLNQSK